MPAAVPSTSPGPEETGSNEATDPAPSSSAGVAGAATVSPIRVTLAPPDRIRGDALRRSLYYCTFAWGFGAFWIASTGGATQVRLAEYLGADDRLFGLMAATPFIGALFQVPGAMRVEKLGARKAFFLRWLTTQRIGYFLIALVPWLMMGLTRLGWVSEKTSAGAVIMAALLIFAWAAGQFGGQAWVNWMADLVPQRVRGKYFARRSRLGVVVVALTGVGLAMLLDFSNTQRFHQLVGPVSNQFNMPPLIFVISVIYVLAAIAGIIDIQMFRKVDEPRMAVKPQEPLLRRITQPLKDAEFRRYVAYASGLNFACWFAGGMWWPYLFHTLKTMRAQEVANAVQHGRPEAIAIVEAPHSFWTAHTFLTAFLIVQIAYNLGQISGYPVWGRAVDRFGRKPCMYIASVVHTVTWIPLLFIGPATLPYLIGVQFLAGLFFSGAEIAGFNMMLSFNRKGVGYQGLASMLISVFAAAGGVAGGAVAFRLERMEEAGAVFTLAGKGFSRYHIIIVLAMCMKMLADILLLARVHDPESKPRRQAMRFMLDNFYGNLNTVIFTPVRTGLEVTGRTITGAGEVVKEKVTEVAESAGANFKRWFR